RKAAGESSDKILKLKNAKTRTLHYLDIDPAVASASIYGSYSICVAIFTANQSLANSVKSRLLDPCPFDAQSPPASFSASHTGKGYYAENGTSLGRNPTSSRIWTERTTARPPAAWPCWVVACIVFPHPSSLKSADGVPPGWGFRPLLTPEP